MSMTVHVDIVSAEGEIHSGVAEMVYAPGEMGELGIAPRHAPLITRLKPGDIRVQTKPGKIEHFYVSGGILEVQPHVVTVLADTAIRARDLDEAAALSDRIGLLVDGRLRALGSLDELLAQAFGGAQRLPEVVG